jgi:hypothetical protein
MIRKRDNLVGFGRVVQIHVPVRVRVLDVHGHGDYNAERRVRVHPPRQPWRSPAQAPCHSTSLLGYSRSEAFWGIAALFVGVLGGVISLIQRRPVPAQQPATGE